MGWSDHRCGGKRGRTLCASLPGLAMGKKLQAGRRKLARNMILKNEGAFSETVLHGRGPIPAWYAVLSQQEVADIHAWLATR